MAFNLLENQTSNGDGSIYEVKSAGYNIVKASGTFDGATITIKFDFYDNDFQPLLNNNTEQTITIPGCQTIVLLKGGVRIRATVSGAGASTDVSLKLVQDLN